MAYSLRLNGSHTGPRDKACIESEQERGLDKKPINKGNTLSGSTRNLVPQRDSKGKCLSDLDMSRTGKQV